MKKRSKDALQENASASQASAKKYLLYGFKTDDKSVAGWLQISEHGEHGPYAIVDDEDFATPFLADGKLSPEEVLKFISAEEELEDWKFHLVSRTIKAASEKAAC